MEAALAEFPTPPIAPPPRRTAKPGRAGRTDVFRTAICPEGHVSRIRIDRIEQAGPFHTRVGYRCSFRGFHPKTGVWGDVRHRFTDRTPIDPLPRRHPTHEHPYAQDTCATCEHQYAPDEGPRAGRHFLYAAADITSLLLGVGGGDPVRQVTAQVRRDALRIRPKTKSHRKPDDGEVPEDELEWLQSIATIDDLDDGHLQRDALYEDSDWDVRFRRGLGEDLVQPDWWDDLPIAEPSAEDLLRSYTHVLVDGRDPEPEAVKTIGEMLDDDRYVSKSFALGAEYVDVFGPAVVAPHIVKKWPETIVIDSLPVCRRALVESNETTRMASDFLCEIYAVQDGISKELIALYPVGGKDQESIKEVFATKTGAPVWVVTDGDMAMPKAIATAFPGAVHYRCEEHLRDDARDAAAKDKITDPEVLGAIERAQYTPAHWEHLKAIVAAKVESTRPELRKWMDLNEGLVLHQCVLRRLHPDRPRSTGGVEGPLGTVRRDLDVRRMSLRNRRRLIVVLDLMRVVLAHKARPERFTLIVRQQLEATRLQSITWAEHWDRITRDKRGRRIKTRNTLIGTATWPGGGTPRPGRTRTAPRRSCGTTSAWRTPGRRPWPTAASRATEPCGTRR